MRIAFRLSGLDLLFLRQSEHAIFAIVPLDSREEFFARQVLRLKNLICITLKTNKKFTDLSTEEILQKSDLGKQLKLQNIDYFLTTRTTPYLENWSKKSNIKIIGQNIKAKIYENKIYFRDFLQKHNLPQPDNIVIKRLPTKMPFAKTVLQLPDSYGSEGTFVVESKETFQKLLAKLQLPVLAREFILGTSFGVTIAIHKKNFCLSAIDRQCFLSLKSKLLLGHFCGIQWVPANFFSKDVYLQIGKLLGELARKLITEEIDGLLNVDFILDQNNNLMFLECNPRLTLASNQIFTYAELGLPGLLKFLLHGELPKTTSTLPRNTFEGCLMLIELDPETNRNNLRKFIPSSFYHIDNSFIKELKLDNYLNFLSLESSFLYYNELNSSGSYAGGTQAGTVFSNIPLFDPHSGKANALGEKVSNLLTPKC